MLNATGIHENENLAAALLEGYIMYQKAWKEPWHYAHPDDGRWSIDRLEDAKLAGEPHNSATVCAEEFRNGFRSRFATRTQAFLRFFRPTRREGEIVAISIENTRRRTEAEKGGACGYGNATPTGIGMIYGVRYGMEDHGEGMPELEEGSDGLETRRLSFLSFEISKGFRSSTILR